MDSTAKNLKGIFNVPIGAKDRVVFEDEDFSEISEALKVAEIYSADFEIVIDRAEADDFVFADPPYTTMHNVNGFVKYNQRIFSWRDQIRLKDAIVRASDRGAMIILTNADHDSIRQLYGGIATFRRIERASVIAGNALHRRATTEGLYIVG